ncbi:MAG: hypothetical protein ACI97A_000560 [Planctomycetota bacterium]|jgi:hypothetical protein
MSAMENDESESQSANQTNEGGPDTDSQQSLNSDPDQQDPEESNIDLPAVNVEVDIEYDTVVNFAMQQNDVPVVKLLTIRNLSGGMEDVCISVGFANNLSEPLHVRIDRVGDRQEIKLDHFPLLLSAEILSEQKERELTAIEVEISAAGTAPRTFAFPIEILAVNEWPGINILPEILAAFVFPNDDIVNGILARALRHHEERVSVPSFDGYQSGSSAKVVDQIRSIYESLAAEDLGYVGAPASFEQDGQKVRLPDTILQHRLGNCLDFSLLAAAVMEQCSLHPVVVISKGHAFCGAWTRSHSFSEPTVDDVATLRKRIDVEDILVFETTLLAQRPLVPFHVARSEARRHLDQDDDFLIVIDICAARKLKIRPLSLRNEVKEEPAPLDNAITINIDPSEIAKLGLDSDISTDRIKIQDQILEEQPPTAIEDVDRIGRWQRRLLDLSLRNRLLNFKESKKNLAFLVPQPGILEDALEEGAVFSLRGKPSLGDQSQHRDLDLQRSRTQEDAEHRFLVEELQNHTIHADASEKETEARLLDLYRAAKNGLEETGANTLYLAVGFLNWYETEDSGLERRAPILMIPMQLVRKSARDGFKLRRADEDARINTTLLEKLKQDFEIETGNLQVLPEDESGIDVDLVLKQFRKAIMDIPRWDVSNHTALGLFSFNKFLMWTDLEEHADRLLDSKVVKHLVESPGSGFETDAVFPDSNELDITLPAAENLCPLDADSSQLRAVVAAAEGRTFVLQGPPGTGKSQTITNLIAHCLAQGKRVLFVAEKMAALNVVHDRLSQVGLESSCLELHSNKTSKRHVVEQLRQAIDAANHQDPSEWEQLAAELTDRRDDLNAYVAEIHHRYSPGLSVFEATSRLCAKTNVPQVDLGFVAGHEIQRSELDILYELADALGTAAADIAPTDAHPLQAMHVHDWSPKLESQIDETITRVQAAGLKVQSARVDLSEALGLPSDVRHDSRRQWQLLSKLMELLLENPGTTRALLTEPGWRAIQETLQASIERGKELAELRGNLKTRFAEELLATDVSSWLESLQKARSSFPPLSWFRVFFTKRALRPFAKLPLSDTDSLVLDLGRIQKFRAEERHLNEVCDQEKRFFGHHWRGAKSNWTALENSIRWVGEVRAIVAELGQDPEWIASGSRERTLSLAAEESDLISGPTPTRKLFEAFIEEKAHFDEMLAFFKNLTELDDELAFGTDCESGFVERMDAALAEQQGGLSRLRGWCHWSRLVANAELRGMAEFCTALGAGTIESGDAVEILEKSFLEFWLENQLESSTLLRRFNSREHERKIRAFSKLDKKLLALSSEVIKARVNAALPGFSKEAAAKSEVGILQRQLKLKRRHMPIRKLFHALPELLPRLKPCLLMSPLSVAQYLSADYPRADIVVFDEASQIPVWDAIGALSRGNSAIIVGDSKQLPPTSFFHTQEDDEGDYDGDLVEEVESILDECEAGGLSSINLAWHYRSRHEDLIAFSNHHYYNNRLMTFPSSGNQRANMGVSLISVPEGRYDRSKTRTNDLEAQTVVADVVRRLQAVENEKDFDTIGVVAFSQAQQTHIEDLLDQARRENPTIERFFSDGLDEPVFVKNLENVQGDERDVILFSICYGPDNKNKVSMNFGPLNREGGERRLNVAITRARKELAVFSTLRSDQIDLSRTRATGVAHLRSFLEFAARGPVALPTRVGDSSQAQTGTPLTNSIAERLREAGHDVVQEVGSSAYPIDVAIRDPQDNERFLLGIECDGNRYRDAATARDRDRIRSSVLSGLGWDLCRIWASDWLENPEAEIERINSIISGSLQEEDEEDQAVGMDTTDVAVDDGLLESALADSSEVEEELTLKLVEEVNIYRPSVLKPIAGGIDAFFDDQSKPVLLEYIGKILEQEAPVSRSLLCRRLIEAFGIERLVGKIRDRIDGLLAELDESQMPADHDGILFAPGSDPQSYQDFRTAALGEIPRQADDIHPVEIANAAKRVLKEQVALPRTEMPKETARMLGFPRLGTRVRAAMEKGIEELLKQGWGIVDNDQVKLPRSFPEQDSL